MIATIPPQINEMSTVDALRVLIQGQTKNGGAGTCFTNNRSQQ